MFYCSAGFSTLSSYMPPIKEDPSATAVNVKQYRCYRSFWRKGRAAKVTLVCAQEETALFCFVLVSVCLILGSKFVVVFPGVMPKLFLPSVLFHMSLNFVGKRSADFTESFTFSCIPLLLIKYRDSSLDLRYNLGNPYVYSAGALSRRTRKRAERTSHTVSAPHNEASTTRASVLRFLHTYVSYRQGCHLLGDGKRQHLSTETDRAVHTSQLRHACESHIPLRRPGRSMRLLFSFFRNLLSFERALRILRGKFRAAYITEGIASARKTTYETHPKQPMGLNSMLISFHVEGAWGGESHPGW